MSFVRVQQEINVPQIIFRTVGETTTMVTFGQKKQQILGMFYFAP